MQLPSHYLITPSPVDESEFLKALERSLAAGISLMQFRAKGMGEEAYQALAEKVVALARGYDCRVLLSAPTAMVLKVGADGIHLDSRALAACDSRPLPSEYLVAASAHTLEELKKAEVLGADFALLSPVKYTKSHPDIEPLGWTRFGEMIQQVSLPVFALGGVSVEDEEAAHKAGAQGLAGAKGYWRA